jgi:molybdate-binding protein/DNA-binding XRE family transcriptional regulator
MGDEPRLDNQVRLYREQRGWSQEELARRSGLSRAGISAIETGRLVPSTAASLSLAAILECSVEDLFTLSGVSHRGVGMDWAWPPPRIPWPYWKANVGGFVRAYPVEVSALGLPPHDGVFRNGAFHDLPHVDPALTLVLATCDPAVGILARELLRVEHDRMIALTRSSQSALELLSPGLVHAAGIHLARAEEAEGNATAIRDQRSSKANDSFRLLRVADWEEGIAASPLTRLGTVRQAFRSSLRWVSREPGSGARACLNDVLEMSGRKRVPHVAGRASDHRGVATAIRDGWADVGICLRLVSEEANLDFLGVRREAYDLCFPDELAGDSRLKALVRVVRSATFRRLLSGLPGYSTDRTGETQKV